MLSWSRSPRASDISLEFGVCRQPRDGNIRNWPCLGTGSPSRSVTRARPWIAISCAQRDKLTAHQLKKKQKHTRQAYYQQRLLLALAWVADSAPTLVVADSGKQVVHWTLKWARPASLAGRALPDINLQISSAGSTDFAYEERCHHFESLFSSSEFVCKCCDGEVGQGPCDTCRYAVGFHVCPVSGVTEHRWCRNTLFGGPVRVPVF